MLPNNLSDRAGHVQFNCGFDLLPREMVVIRNLASRISIELGKIDIDHSSDEK
jgi:hypothetical protein